MSSVELVKIINDMREDGAAILEHSDFMKKIVRVLGVEDAYSREKPCYHLPKREVHLMVMSENKGRYWRQVLRRNKRFFSVKKKL